MAIGLIFVIVLTNLLSLMVQSLHCSWIGSRC